MIAELTVKGKAATPWIGNKGNTFPARNFKNGQEDRLWTTLE